MEEHGFRIKNGNQFLYHETTSNTSIAFGIDSADNKLKLTSSTTSNVLPSAGGNIILDTSANGDILFSANGTGSVDINRASESTGLSFDNGTNTISTFIERTAWTPTLSFGGSSTGITYSSQTGYWSRIGNLVCVFCEIVLTNAGTASGGMAISGYTGPAPASDYPLRTKIEFISYSGGGIAGIIQNTTGNFIIGREVSGGVFTALQRNNPPFSNVSNNATMQLIGIYYV